MDCMPALMGPSLCVDKRPETLSTSKSVVKQYSQSVFYTALATEQHLGSPAVLCFMDAMKTLADSHEDDESRPVVKLLSEIYRLKAIAAESSIILFTQPSPSPFDVHETSSNQSTESSEQSNLSWTTLYSSCLSTVLNMIGCDSQPDRRFELIEHLRKAFRVESSSEHMRMFEAARNEPKAELRLNVSINEAKNLPQTLEESTSCFCILNLMGNSDEVYSKSEKTEAVDVLKDNSCMWNPPALFNLGLGQHQVDHVTLSLEVWKRRQRLVEQDHVERSVVNSDKMDKSGKKKVRRRFKVTELLVGGQKSNMEGSNNSVTRRTKKMLGKIEIEVNAIPASGINQWWSIQHGKKSNGQVRLSVHLSYRSCSASSLLEHRRLLRLLLAYELLKRNSPPFTWRDHFCDQTLTILAQHAVQNGLSREHTAKARFIVYAQIHEVLPLDLRVFTPLLSRLRSSLSLSSSSPSFSSLDSELMERSTQFATHLVITLVRQHRLLLAADADRHSVQLEHALKALHVIHCFKWRARDDVVLLVEQTLLKAHEEWIEFMQTKIEEKDDKTDVQSRLASITGWVRLVALDLETVSNLNLDALFNEHLNIQYTSLYLRSFESCLSRRDVLTRSIEEAVAIMKKASKSLEEANLDGKMLKTWCDTALNLFRLYTELRRLRSHTTTSSMSTMRSVSNMSVSKCSSSLFKSSVSLWLDLGCWETRTRLERSVQLDGLRESATPLVVHSSSAVDVCGSFVKLAQLWTDVIKWEDEEDNAFVFVSRIIDDVCRLSVVFANKMAARVEKENVSNTMASTVSKSEVCVSKQHCLIFNNMDRVLAGIGRVVLDLHVGQLVAAVAAHHGQVAADVCKKSVKTMVKSGVENVENHIVTVMEKVVQLEMASRIDVLIGESVRSSSSTSFLPLLQFLDENLVFVKANLSADNFERLLSVLWSTTTSTLSAFVQSGMDQRMGAEYFVSLLSVFKALLNFFFGDNAPNLDELNDDHDVVDNTLHRSQALTKLLKLHASDVATLMHEYYALRYADQMRVADQPPMGIIVVRAAIKEELLCIEVLNARNLRPSHQHSSAPTTSTTSSTSTSWRGGGGVWALSKSCYTTTPTANTMLSSSSPSSSTLGMGSLLRAKVDRLKLVTSSSLNRNPVVNWMGHKHGQSPSTCNPYVKLRLVPCHSDKIENDNVCKTKVHQQTLFPLFDETFEMTLANDTDLSRSYLQLVVKHKPVVGSGLFVGEAYLPLSRVFRKEGTHVDLKELPQLQLVLSRPSSELSDLVFAVETRTTDAIGREFVRKERNKADQIF